MNITILRSTICQPQCCGRAQSHAISHAANFIAPPRRVAQAAHTTRNFTVTKALEDGTGPEQVRRRNYRAFYLLSIIELIQI